MMEQIGKLSIGDKFTETAILGDSDRILTVEMFTDDGLVVARDAKGWGQCFDKDDLVNPVVRITQK